jgi:hypothetical protein
MQSTAHGRTGWRSQAQQSGDRAGFPTRDPSLQRKSPANAPAREQFSFFAAMTRLARRFAWLESLFVSTFDVTVIASCARRAI